LGPSRRGTFSDHKGSFAVQTTLLGVAIAVILALVAALVAPLVVDWSQYRAAFEDQASRLTGLTVHVNGSIDARLLPSPHFKLRDVTVGGAGREPQIRAAAIDLELGLGPLMRGEVRATEMRLLAPRISLRLDNAGVLDWSVPASTPGTEALAASRLTVENGRVVFSDAASGTQLALEKLSFTGDVRSLLGPFTGEGAFVAGGEPFGFRISGSRAGDDGNLKVRLGVDPADHPLNTEIEGLLGFQRGIPQFDGTFSVVRPVGAMLAGGKRVMSDPWQLAGKLQATPVAVKLQEVALQYGPEERAVVFNGKGDLKLGAHPQFEGDITARQVDVDRMLAAPDLTHRPPLIMFKSLLEEFIAGVRPPMPLSVGVAVESVTVGGAAIQALRGRVRFAADGGWALDDIAFRAPGFTTVKLSGRVGDAAQGLLLGGPASIESADLKMLAAWLEGRSDQTPGPAQTLTARGDVTIARDRFVLDHLSAALDREKLEGRLAYSFAAGNRPAALDADLHAARLDIDAIGAFAQAAASDGGFDIPHAVSLTLDVGEAVFAGIDARALNARLTLNTGVLHLDRLSIGDLGGAAIEASGRIDELSSQPRGQITIDVSAATLEGLAAIAGRYAPQVPASVRPFSARLAPAKVRGALTIERAGKTGSVAKLTLGGTLGAMRLALNGEATGVPAQADSATLRISGRLDADDGGALVRLLALDRVLAVDQLPGQLTVTANGPLNGEIRVNALASAGGFSATADGAMHLRGEGAPTGSLQLKANAVDLRPLQRAMTGQVGGAPSAPVSLNAIVGIAGPDLSVTDLTVKSGKASLRGRLDLKVADPLAVAGEISGDDLDLAAAASLLFGLPPGAAKSFSAAPVGGGVFGLLNGSVSFKFDRAMLTPAWIARDLKGVARFAAPEIELADLEAKLAGGRLSGGFTFRHDPQSFAGHGHVEITDANAAAIAGSSMIDGLLSARLQGESQGLSPEGIVGALHGGGTISLARAQFAGFNPTAFDAAMRLADQNAGVVDAAKVRTTVSAAMDSGKLAVTKADAEVTIAGGQVRVANAILPAPDGAQIALDGALDLNTAAMNAQLTLSADPAANALVRQRPELAVTLKGPLAAPERKLDVSALLGWLGLRAAEQQTRRLESLEANRRADVVGDLGRPVPPAMRFVPQGTALEINNHANASAAPPPGTNLLDRLRPEVPPAAAVSPLAIVPPPIAKPANPPGPASDKSDKTTDKTGTATGAVRPAPLPGLRSLLNSLFGSQN
jgi:uncharacterized protein involved in outer membrane biogenesis